MKIRIPAVACSVLFAVALLPSATADLISNGTFTSIAYSGTLPLTTPFGQFGTGTGSQLTIANWTTTGYNFVYTPGTADSGTQTGANAGAPNEAPGQYNTSAGYGSTYLYGKNNGGVGTIPTNSPGGGNFIAADGAYETAAITQSISGLTSGKVYALNFSWAAAQQQGFAGATTNAWQVSLGSETHSTSVINLASHDFSGWRTQTLNFTATAANEVLSFLAVGTPSGQPPFALLTNVTLNPVPEPSAWVLCFGFGTLCMYLGMVRRRRRRQACQAGGLS